MKKSKNQSGYGIYLVIGIVILFIVLFLFNNKPSFDSPLDNDKKQGQSCKSTDGVNSNCKDGLLCNVGSGGENGVCNTIQQCISSGSTAEAFEGSKICFMGV